MCQFLLYSRVNQLYVDIHPLFFGFPSHLGHHRALSRIPCVIQQVLISYLFYTSSVYMSIPNSHFIPLPPAPLGIHTLKKKLINYLFILGCIGSLLLHAGFLQLQRAGATLVAVCGLLIAVASLVVEHSLQVCGLQQLWLTGSRAQAQQMWRIGLVAPWHVGSLWTRA